MSIGLWVCTRIRIASHLRMCFIQVPRSLHTLTYKYYTSLFTEVLFLVGVGQMSSSWNLEIIIQNMYGQCCSPGHAVYAYLVCWTFSESFRMRGSEVNGLVI